MRQYKIVSITRLTKSLPGDSAEFLCCGTPSPAPPTRAIQCRRCRFRRMRSRARRAPSMPQAFPPVGTKPLKVGRRKLERDQATHGTWHAARLYLLTGERHQPSGAIVGFAFGSNLAVSQAFVWRAETGMQALVDLGGGASLAQAINTEGTAVGWSYDAAGCFTPCGGTRRERSPISIPPERSARRSTSTIKATSSAGSSPTVVRLRTPICGGTTACRLIFKLWAARAARPSASITRSPSSASRTRPRLSPTAFIWRPATGMRDLRMGPNSQALAINDLAARSACA